MSVQLPRQPHDGRPRRCYKCRVSFVPVPEYRYRRACVMLTAAEVAAQLRTSERTIARMVADGCPSMLVALAHLTNLDALAHGRADNTTLWHAVEAAFTWSRVAQLLGIGEAEMAQQLALLEGVLARYKRSGRVGFSGPEYQTAKDGVDVMDELARLVDRATAVEAANWSEARMDAIRYHTTKP